jgi:hypothetical protein
MRQNLWRLLSCILDHSLFLFTTLESRAGGEAQAVEHLPSKHEALSSNPIPQIYVYVCVCVCMYMYIYVYENWGSKILKNLFWDHSAKKQKSPIKTHTLEPKVHNWSSTVHMFKWLKFYLKNNFYYSEDPIYI